MDLSMLRHYITNMADVDSTDVDPKKTIFKDLILYQPFDNEQTLSDLPNCLSVQAFLRMCSLSFDISYKHNAEDMSPSGEVPILKCDDFLLSNLETIVQLFNERGISLTKNLEEPVKSEMKAYISLVRLVLENAENYMIWSDSETFEKLTIGKFQSLYPWPLYKIQARRKQQKELRKLNAMGWIDKTVEDVCVEVDTCCNALSNKLDGKYFFGDLPTELDALVFAHVYTILTIPQPKSNFSAIVFCYPKIIEHCQRITNEYFGDCNSVLYLKKTMIN